MRIWFTFRRGTDLSKFYYIFYPWHLTFFEAWSERKDPQWFCAIDSQFFLRDSSRSWLVSRTQRSSIPHRDLPLISSSFSRSSSSTSPPRLLLVSFFFFQFSFHLPSPLIFLLLTYFSRCTSRPRVKQLKVLFTIINYAKSSKSQYLNDEVFLLVFKCYFT